MPASRSRLPLIAAGLAGVAARDVAAWYFLLRSPEPQPVSRSPAPDDGRGGCPRPRCRRPRSPSLAPTLRRPSATPAASTDANPRRDSVADAAADAGSRATPSPTPRPAPTPRPQTTAARHTAGDGRALLRAGRSSRGRPVASRPSLAPGARGRFSHQLLTACSTDTIAKAVQAVPADELFILPVTFQGRSCYRLCWGVYDTPPGGRGRAQQRAGLLPAGRHDTPPLPAQRTAPLTVRRFVLLAAALVAAPGAGSADSIVLTSGRVIEADQAWFEGAEIRYLRNETVYSVPRALVARVDAAGGGASLEDPDAAPQPRAPRGRRPPGGAAPRAARPLPPAAVRPGAAGARRGAARARRRRARARDARRTRSRSSPATLAPGAARRRARRQRRLRRGARAVPARCGSRAGAARSWRSSRRSARAPRRPRARASGSATTAPPTSRSASPS